MRREKEVLEQQNRQPPEELLKQHASANSEVDQLKEMYRTKNEEIEQLIEQVLKTQKEAPATETSVS